MSAPDWKFWLLEDRVKNWQAAALSLGINPYDIHKHPEFWDQHGGQPSFERRWFRSDAQMLEFQKRCQLVDAFNRQIPNATVRMNLIFTDSTTLAEFARWALANTLELPPEMAELGATEAGFAGAVGAAATKATSENEWTPGRRDELRKEHAKLVAGGCKSPTRTLAQKYNISETRVRELKARSKGDAVGGKWSQLLKK